VEVDHSLTKGPRYHISYEHAKVRAPSPLHSGMPPLAYATMACTGAPWYLVTWHDDVALVTWHLVTWQVVRPLVDASRVRLCAFLQTALPQTANMTTNLTELFSPCVSVNATQPVHAAPPPSAAPPLQLPRFAALNTSVGPSERTRRRGGRRMAATRLRAATTAAAAALRRSSNASTLGGVGTATPTTQAQTTAKPSATAGRPVARAPLRGAVAAAALPRTLSAEEAAAKRERHALLLAEVSARKSYQRASRDLRHIG
jgi:hypothetical protein